VSTSWNNWRCRWGVGCGIGWVVFVVAIIVFNVVVGGYATKYVLDYWGSYVRGTHVDMPLVPCMLAGLFVAEAAVPAAIATFILSAFLNNPAY